MSARIKVVKKVCRHCRKCVASRPRGLCNGCHLKPAIRELYPRAESVFNHRGLGAGTHNRPVPAEPTAAMPGTEAKIAVMAARAAREEALWHPGDAVDTEHLG